MGDQCIVCYSCGQTSNRKHYNITAPDPTDNISYLDKLQLCIDSNLIQQESMKMCWLCVKHLRISYKFRETVLAVQAQLQDPLIAGLPSLENEELKEDPQSETEVESAPKRKTRKQTDLGSLDCEFCGAHFLKKFELKRHVERVHSRRFVCSYCQKDFKQSCHLKEHILCHTGEKQYSCHICDKQFFRMSSQRRHVKSHNAPPGQKTKRTPFLCTICGKSFPFSNGVQRHMRIHFGIKNFECAVCGKRFTQSTHLQVHMRTHTGEKPYICDTCGEKFSLKACLQKHISNRHHRSGLFQENYEEKVELPILFTHKDFETA